MAVAKAPARAQGAIAVAMKRKPSKAGTARPPVDLAPLFRFLQRKGKDGGDPQTKHRVAVTMLVHPARSSVR